MIAKHLLEESAILLSLDTYHGYGQVRGMPSFYWPARCEIATDRGENEFIKHGLEAAWMVLTTGS